MAAGRIAVLIAHVGHDPVALTLDVLARA